jgi:hypothetical protein
MTRHGAILRLRWATGNHHILAYVRPRLGLRPGPRNAQRAPGAQAAHQFALERAASLNVEGLVNGLVRDAYGITIRALINDQWSRLDSLCEELEISVVGWHGDVSSSKKQRFFKNPTGVLLITPESLEAMFVNRGSSMEATFASLRYIVVDELHAFIGSERGKQLQSLMYRVERACGHTVPRVGLSARHGDMRVRESMMD